MPNTLAPVIVQGTYSCPSAVIVEASLSFLGAGTPPHIPSGGNIMAEGRPYIQRAFWIIFFLGLFVAITVLAINLVGDGLCDTLDPKLARCLWRIVMPLPLDIAGDRNPPETPDSDPLAAGFLLDPTFRPSHWRAPISKMHGHSGRSGEVVVKEKACESLWGGLWWAKAVGYLTRGDRVEALEASGTLPMPGVRNGIDRRASQWLVLAIGTRLGAIALLGILCHHPGAQEFIPGQAHLAHTSAEHCPTWVASLPTLSLVWLCIVIVPAMLTPREGLLFTPRFNPPRPLSPVRDGFIAW